MSVGFRSFLGAASERVVDAVVDHVNHWSETKEINVDAGSPGRYELDGDDVITVTRHDDAGRHLYRWRRLHPLARDASDIWRTTITAVQGAGRPGWLWTEIEVADEIQGDRAPRAPFMSVPTFLRALLADLPCHDGLVPVAVGPRWVSPADLPDLMDYLADESRLGPVYVARAGSRSADEFADWAANVGWEVVGLGSMFLLGAEADTEFNEMVGPGHAIPDGAIRTYLPGVCLDDALDPKRHQILGTVRIDRTGPRRLAYILGLSQRDRTLSAPLPAEAWDADRRLCALEADSPDGSGYVDLRLLPIAMADDAGAVVCGEADIMRRGATVPLPDGGLVSSGQSSRHTAPPYLLTRRGQHRRLVELLAENDRLRAEIDDLRDRLSQAQRSDSTVAAALDALDEQFATLRRRLGYGDADWRRLSAM